MFDQETIRAIGAEARRIKVEASVLQAVIEVESAGKVFARVKGRQEPLIRWEGHYFYRRLKGAQRDEAVRLGLASSRPGGVPNPSSQEVRWAIVTRASKINRLAALESFSIGLGQVMTAHWQMLGFGSVDEMIKLAREGAAGQVQVMVRYIENFGLVDELQRKDFTGFARGFNGPGYAKGGYHTKMAAAYRRLSGKRPVSEATGMLRMGSSGARVRELQALLVRAGHPVKVDGDYGPSTREAVKAFQRSQKIAADGVAGPETQRRLSAYKVDPEENVGQQKVTDTKEAREGIGGAIGGVTLEAARTQVDELSSKISWLPGLEWLGTILGIVAALLVIGGLAWAAYGWWKSRQTDEGDVEPVEIDVAEADDPVLA